MYGLRANVRSRPVRTPPVQNLNVVRGGQLIARSNCFVYDRDFHLWEDANGLDRDL